MKTLVSVRDHSDSGLIVKVLKKNGCTATQITVEQASKEIFGNTELPLLWVVDWNENDFSSAPFIEKFQQYRSTHSVEILFLISPSEKEHLIKNWLPGSCYFVSKPLDAYAVEAQIIQISKSLAKPPSRYQALGSVLRGLSHDLNNPLTIVSGTSQQLPRMAKESPITLEKLQPILQRMDRNIERIVMLVKGLAFMSADFNHDDVQEITPHKLLEDVLPFCQQRLNKGGVELQVHFPEKQPTLHCRPLLTSQAILVLLHHAYHSLLEEMGISTEPSPAVVLTSKKSGTLYEFKINFKSGKNPSAQFQSIFQELDFAKHVAENQAGKFAIETTPKETQITFGIPLIGK